MSQDPKARVHASFRWQSLLNAIASLALIGAAVFVVWAQRPSSARVERAQLKIPTAPLSIEKTSTTTGSSKAPIVMIVFSDFECPFCGRFAREVLPTIQKEYIESGTLQFVHRHLPLRVHPNALSAAEASECAAAQGLFWPFHDAVFAAERQIGSAYLREVATSLDMDVDAFDYCLGSQATRANVSREIEAAEQLGISSTPSFLLGSRLPDGRVQVSEAFSGAPSLDHLRAKLDRAIGVHSGS
jgi:protein-disulfide isomerase